MKWMMICDLEIHEVTLMVVNQGIYSKVNNASTWRIYYCSIAMKLEPWIMFKHVLWSF